MDTESFLWLGAGFCFLALFLMSLFHVSLGAISKISLRRFMEEKEKKIRTRIFEIFDDLKVSVEFLRNIFFIASLIFAYMLIPRFEERPLWMFLIAAGVYLAVLEFLPRIIAAVALKQVLFMFLPSALFFRGLAFPVLFILRIRESDRDEEIPREASDEEIQALIEEAKDEGIIEIEEGKLLKSIVEFGDTIVREIMTPRVSMICIRNDASIEKLRELVIKEMHSRIPVYKERIDNIDGLVMAKDLLAYSEDVHKTAPITPLIREAYFIPESMNVSELLKEFQKRKIKMAVVVDEHGGVSGLVTMEDLMEEIVGEIQDEYDEDEESIIKNGPEDYSVSGNLDIEDVEELFEVDLAEDEYLTIGGLVIHSLGRLPEEGEILKIKGLSFEILEVGQKRIHKLRIKKV